MPHLSAKAMQLLEGAISSGVDGDILVVTLLDGFHCAVNGRDVLKEHSQREENEWRTAVQELQAHGYITAETDDSIYRLTDVGMGISTMSPLSV